MDQDNDGYRQRQGPGANKTKCPICRDEIDANGHHLTPTVCKPTVSEEIDE